MCKEEAKYSIMVKFRLSVGERGQICVPRAVREEFNNTQEIEMIANLRSAVIFPVGASAKEVLRSLEVIKLDLEHRVEHEENQKSGNISNTS